MTKYFVKTTFSLKNLQKSWFNEIFFQWEEIIHFSTLCTAAHCVTEIYNFYKSWKNKGQVRPLLNKFFFSKIGRTRCLFPSNQFIVKFFSKTLIWRNFCEKIVAVKFRNFHSTVRTLWKKRNFTLTLFWQKFRQNNGFTKTPASL